MSNNIVVRHCSPTLAGLKIGNIFNDKFEDINTLYHSVKNLNMLLNSKGVYIKILKVCGNRALIYIYRKQQLAQLLLHNDIQSFLKKHGYADFCVDEVLHTLIAHLKNAEFPHEIGVFLGYPLDDIKSFIENKGCNHKCVGCWKVYHNENEALKTFNKFKKCTRIYCEKIAQGFDITRLTVVG